MSTLRQDKRRLGLENYPLRFDARPLYGDVDTNRHVNNVTVARWFEESRAQLNHRVAGVARLLDPPPGVQLLLVSIQIEYLQQVPYPSAVTVAAAVGRLGGASYAVAHGLFHDGSCAALGESVVVQARDGRPLRLTPEERAALQPLASFDLTESAQETG
jgi:acyl-CoA thioester hydrolase